MSLIAMLNRADIPTRILKAAPTVLCQDKPLSTNFFDDSNQKPQACPDFGADSLFGLLT